MNSFYHTLKSNYAYELNDLSTAYREALTAYQLGSKSLQESLILARMGVALSEFSIVDNIIDSLLVVYPNDPEVVFMAARKFEKSGQTGQAIDQYQKGIAIDPEREENYYYLAQLYLELDNARSALKMLDQFELPNLEPRLAALKAAAFKSTGQVDSAANYYSFLVANEKDSLVYQQLIDLYSSNDKRQELTEIATLAADSFPKSKYFVRKAGEVLDNRYKYEDALVYYRRLYKLDTLDTLVAEEISVLQRKIAYLQRKRKVERMENSIPIQRITLPSLDSIN
jgi:tetratricopeptide (TPR) repeat protein